MLENGSKRVVGFENATEWLGMGISVVKRVAELENGCLRSKTVEYSQKHV